jgi:hypothetical protein
MSAFRNVFRIDSSSSRMARRTKVGSIWEGSCRETLTILLYDPAEYLQSLNRGWSSREHLGALRLDFVFNAASHCLGLSVAGAFRAIGDFTGIETAHMHCTRYQLPALWPSCWLRQIFDHDVHKRCDSNMSRFDLFVSASPSSPSDRSIYIDGL